MPQLVPFPTDSTKYHGVKEFSQIACANLEIAHNAIIKAHINATYKANQACAEEKPFKVGDLAYLLMANINLLK
jgi:hypothetical protein